MHQGTTTAEVIVSLQGTLDTFSLPDVLRFLAGAAKSGRLAVDESKRRGELWLDGGTVVHVDVDGAESPQEALFQLLRDPDGSFAFDGDLTTSSAGAPMDVEALIADAQARLVEWREIEAVVPSLDAPVSLTPRLKGGSATVTDDQWQVISAVGSGTSVGIVGDTLRLGEFDTCRVVKSLVDAGLVVIGGPGGGAVADVDETDEALEDAPAAVADVTAPTADEPDEATLLAAELAKLGPEATKAVEAAARATTDEERDAALASVTGADDEPINRGLLLKFLSSVRT